MAMISPVLPGLLLGFAVYSVAFGAAIAITRPSGIVTVSRNPNGLPSFAGRNFTLMLSPLWRAFSPVLPTPPLRESRGGTHRHHPLG